MKISRVSVAILFASMLLLIAAIPSGAAVKGPREDDMAIYFYATQEAAYTALTAGNIDFILYDITSLQADNAFTNPNIITCNVPDAGFYEFDLNNNYTIDVYPGIRSPMNYSELRKAIAFLSDKDYYVGTLHAGKAVRIDQMIAGPFYGWANESMSYPYYPYEYDPAAAKTMLDSKFPVGTTTNPNYNPSNPLSSQYLRQYPADHPQKPGQDLDPLIFYVRVEHNARLMSGRGVYQALQEMGVPIDATECVSAVSYDPVMGEFNYHFYTGGWSVGRFPPISSYGLYHSINAFPYGGNYVTGGHFPFVGDNATDPRMYRTHPKLDEYLRVCNYAITYSEAVTACKAANGYMTEICMNVPLWSVSSFWAWSNKLLGMVNQQGADVESGYTFMNAYKTDGSPIRCGTINYPTALNIVYSSWVYDYNNLDRMNLYGGVDVPAYNVAADQVGFVDDFETTTWDGGTKTKVVMSFREDAYTAKPVSGDLGENINANTYFWNAWMEYQIGDGWTSSGFFDLHHVAITGPYDFEIYFTTLSYWNTYYAQGALRPMNLWMAQGDAFIADETETNPAVDGDGVVSLTYDPIWFDSITIGGNALTFMADYNIILGNLVITNDHGYTGDLVVNYWRVPDAALRGFTPGVLSWQTIFEGAGMYYCTAYSSGVSATYKRNPFYYCVTPLLGDIDFVKDPSGNYVIDIVDVVLVGGAYGSTGTLIPSGNWLPGADVAPAAGVIDIYDVTTVTSKYGQQYDPIEP